ncbi:MAG: hypothetical protein ACOX6Y_06625 [Christensenellales bacterium]
MKVSLNWVKEYVSLPDSLSMEQLSYDLTMRTVEVEGAVNPADALSGCVLGVITQIRRPPPGRYAKGVRGGCGAGGPGHHRVRRLQHL